MCFICVVLCLALMPTGEIIETKWSTTRLPHLLIRSIAVVSLIDAGLEFVYPQYGRALAKLVVEGTAVSFQQLA